MALSPEGGHVTHLEKVLVVYIGKCNVYEKEVWELMVAACSNGLAPERSRFFWEDERKPGILGFVVEINVHYCFDLCVGSRRRWCKHQQQSHLGSPADALVREALRLFVQPAAHTVVSATGKLTWWSQSPHL